jgi:N-acetylneuraminic acid mutarotase
MPLFPKNIVKLGSVVETRKTTIIVTMILCLVLPISSVFAVEEDYWTTMEPMPTPGAWIGAAVVNEKIYAIGGNGGYGSSSVYEYDPITDTWTTKTSMPNPRINFGIAVIENKIYIIGGDRGNYDIGITTTAINEVYDPATDTWEMKTSMPTRRMAVSANVVDGKIYVIGGGEKTPNTNLTPTDVNEVYDPETDKWTTLEPIPNPVNYHTSAVVDSKIYVMGGAVNVNLNQIYDPETDTWSSGAPLPTGVDSAATGVTTGIFAPKRIYVIGGKQNLDAVKLNQVYDPETDTWVYRWAMPTARYGLGVAIINDTIYAIGGREGWVGFPVSAANEKYTPSGYIPEFSSSTILVAGLSVVLGLSIIYRYKFRKEC